MGCTLGVGKQTPGRCLGTTVKPKSKTTNEPRTYGQINVFIDPCASLDTNTCCAIVSTFSGGMILDMDAFVSSDDFEKLTRDHLKRIRGTPFCERALLVISITSSSDMELQLANVCLEFTNVVVMEHPKSDPKLERLCDLEQFETILSIKKLHAFESVLLEGVQDSIRTGRMFTESPKYAKYRG
jgi:hypothetical protein